MFDTNVTHVRHSGPSRIDVHEHRQSAADDARLLNELQREAEKRIIAALPLESNTLKAVVSLQHFVAQNVYALVCFYEINGRTLQSQVERMRHNVQHPHQQDEFILELRNQIAQDIANELINFGAHRNLFHSGPTANFM